jgi:hypothetical protein
MSFSTSPANMVVKAGRSGRPNRNKFTENFADILDGGSFSLRWNEGIEARSHKQRNDNSE